GLGPGGPPDSARGPRIGAMKLSVLDQSVAVQGRGEDTAIRDTLDLAVQCEGLGYHRFWLSEHHGLPTIVGSAPEILMAAIAARTSRMRLGSAGVMLPHYAPLKVAEQFRVLEALAPGRIDLGVGRAPGGDMRTAQALNPNAMLAAEAFPELVRDLQAWSALPRHRGITAHPLGPHAPQVWILGSSDYGAQLAAHFGLPYAFAYFFTDGHGVEQALELYRRNYRPSVRYPEPQATICVWALAADTEEEARRLAGSREHSRALRESGIREALVSPEEAAAYPYTDAQRASIERMRRKAYVGTAAQVAAGLSDLATRLVIVEPVIVTWTYDPAPRHHSYELLAAAFPQSPVR